MVCLAVRKGGRRKESVRMELTCRNGSEGRVAGTDNEVEDVSKDSAVRENSRLCGVLIVTEKN